MWSRAPLIIYRTQLISWLALAVLAAGLFGSVGGAWLAYRYATQQGETAMAKLRRDLAIVQAENTRRAAVRYQAEVERGNQLAMQLLHDRAALQQQRQQLHRRIPYVTTHYQPAAGAAVVRLPAAVFTRGFVRDWNTAFGLRPDDATTDTGVPVGQTQQASPADRWLRPDDLLDSGVSTADILAHAEDMGIWCQALEQQRDRLIDYLKIRE